MRDEILPRTSYGSFAQSAVIPSSEVTARIATTLAYVRPSPITPTDRTGVRIANDCHRRPVQAGRLDLVDHDPVGLAQRVEPLAR